MSKKVTKAALVVFILYLLIGVYAPFFASSKPIVLMYQGKYFFPLFRYLFYSGFFTKKIDIFFNLLMLVLPLVALFSWWCSAWRKWIWIGGCGLQIILFLFVQHHKIKDPARPVPSYLVSQGDVNKTIPSKLESIDSSYRKKPNFFSYAMINPIVEYHLKKRRHSKIVAHLNTRLERKQKRNKKVPVKSIDMTALPTLWQKEQEHRQKVMIEIENKIQRKESLYEDLMDRQKKEKEKLDTLDHSADLIREIQRQIANLKEHKLALERQEDWLKAESEKISGIWMPWISEYHWEDDAGGSQELNRSVHFWYLTRMNGKDLTAAVIFGVRISIAVGLISVLISLSIAIPYGCVTGFFGGKIDMILSRFLEIWETMPTFLMLLTIVAIAESKSIFLVVLVLGVFGWTGLSRLLRGEVLKQRHMNYVEACYSLGYSPSRIIWRHILPNAIPPVLTLLPFTVMIAITHEAGLSYLGLGEEGLASWGVLMEEGRHRLFGGGGVLWPPAIALSIFLISIAILGDGLRDALDPKTA